MTSHPGRRARVAILAIALLAAVGVAPPAAAIRESAAQDSVTAVFGSKLIVHGATIDASPGPDDAASNVVQRGGRDCWEIGKGRPSQYLYATLDPAYKHSGTNYAAVDVSYFDAPGTKFALVYDAVGNPWKTSRIVETAGSNTWKTAHYFLNDAAFARNEDGRDLRIATWATDMGSSPAPVCFGAFSLTPSPIGTDDVQVKVTTLGNVFASGAAATFGVLSARDGEVGWSVRDYDGRTIRSGTSAIDATSREGTISVGTLPDGYYTVSVNGTDHLGAPVTRTAGFAVMAAAPDPATTADSMYGVSHHRKSVPGFSWEDTTALAAKAGIENVRVDSTYWNVIEKPKGSYNFPAVSDLVARNLTDNGQQGLYLLGLGNADYGTIPSTPEGYEGFGRYAAAVAEHYRGQTGGLEVWNEYYGGFTSGVCSQNAKCYAKMLAATYPKVKAVAPEVPVVGASSFKVPLDWFDELFQLGGLANMDAISIHPYRAPGAPEGLGLDIAGLQKLIRKYNGGKDKPIWITEQGWSSSTAKAIGVSEQTQAQSVARTLVDAKAAGIAKFFWYDLVNDGTNPDNSENNFGLLRTTSPDATSLNPKPSYVAYATSARELSGATFAGWARTPDPATHAARFNDPGNGPRTVLWSSDRHNKTVRVRTERPIMLTDMMGAEHTVAPVNGWVWLTLTGDPLYLHAEVGTIEAAPTARISVPSEFAAGDAVPVVLEVDQRGSGLSSNDEVGFTIEGVRTTVPVKPGRVTQAVVRVPAGSVVGTRALHATVDVNGRTVGLAAGSGEVVASTLKVDVSPDLSGAGNRLRITATNRSTANTATLTAVDWSYGDRSGTVADRTTIAPLASRTYFAAVPGQEPFAIKPVTVTAHFTDGRSATDSDSFAFSPIVQARPKLVDGRLTGLDHVPAIDLAAVGTYQKIGPADADGDMWATWDNQNLYVSAVVHEDRFHVAKNPNWLPAGDSIGIGVQPGKPGEGLGSWGAEWFMLYAGQTTEGGKIFVESLPKSYPVGLMDGATVDVVRDESAKTTTYRIAVPWARIAPLSPKDPSFSLTLTVNKNDGVDRDNYRSLGLAGWQEWGDGLNNWKLVNYQQVQLTR